MDKNIIRKSENSLLTFREIWSSEKLHVNWCDMSFENENNVEVYDRGEFIELYFQFNGLSETIHKGEKIRILPNSQGVFYINNYISEHKQFKKEERPLSFLEIRLSIDFLLNMFPAELWEEQCFMRNLLRGTTMPTDPMKPISPQMKSIIWNICNSPFKGIMQRTCLEAQITELFLLQADGRVPILHRDLKKKDVDKLVAVKNFIDLHYQQKMRVADLAKEVGTNQQRLRSGFKILYGTTIFEYYNHLRMERAKHLLINKKMLVSEVSEDIGYKNSQHFTVAFKKKFGVLPSELNR